MPAGVWGGFRTACPSKRGKYIISAIVLAAAKAKGRIDCVAPATNHPAMVRDEQGNIVSVPCLISVVIRISGR